MNDLKEIPLLEQSSPLLSSRTNLSTTRLKSSRSLPKTPISCTRSQAPYGAMNSQRSSVCSLNTTCSNDRISTTSKNRNAPDVSFQKQDEPLSYNGNYEGDISMFDHRIYSPSERSNIFHNNFNKDYHRDVSNFKLKSVDENHWKKYLLQCKNQMKNSELFQQVQSFKEEINKNIYCKKLFELLGLAITILFWLLHTVFMQWGHCGHLNAAIWNSRFKLRHLARHILWKLTFAKCGDFILFLYILVLSPCLFITALAGFIVSLYCTIKNYLFRTNTILIPENEASL